MKRMYDYKCNDCGTIDERIVSGETIEEILAKNVPCLKCGSENTERCVSAPGGISTGFHDKPKTFTKKDYNK